MMSLPRWLARFLPHRSQSGRRCRPGPVRARKCGSRPALHVECLEDRVTPSILTVSNLNDDSSPASLRAASAQANADGGGDTVVFAQGLSGTITLTQGPLEFTAGSGTTDLEGGSQITVSGNTQSQIFRVDVGASVRIGGLTLQEGAGSN